MISALLKSRRQRWQAGGWVQVRSLEEILATLDGEGCLDRLPFMPEMAPYCGQYFRIVQVAHKTCDPTGATNLRRMNDAVHLETRCNGSSHGGCQANCRFFWKTAWLKPVKKPLEILKENIPTAFRGGPKENPIATLCRTTQIPCETAGEIRYRCQSTELLRATTPMRATHLPHYIRDLASRNIGYNVFLWNMTLAILKTLKASIPKRRMASPASPSSPPKRRKEKLHLKPDEMVQVRSREEIMGTLDKDRRHLGLSFDSEMRRHCGGVFRVRDRIERIIDEKTGKMLTISRDCITLDGVVCTGRDCRHRLFCSRGAYMFWREDWLKRAEPDETAQDQKTG